MRPRIIPPFARLGSLFLAFVLLPLPVVAANFGVSPIRIDLGQAARSGTVAVANDEDASQLRLQMNLAEWTQDAAGKDIYRDTEDLLFFPRLMSLEKAERKLVRVGLRGPVTEREKAYRLYIRELPNPPPPGEKPGARVAIAVRFGVPVFVNPIKEDIRGELDRLELAQGRLRVGVRNTGNAHFTIKTLTATSSNGFSKEISGWYLLAGAAREHVMELPAAECAKLKRLDVVVKTDRPLELKGTLDVNASMCRP